VASTEAVSFYGPLMFGTADPPYRFLSAHQAAVLDAATRRLAPRPDDMVSYVDRLLWPCVPNFRDQYINGLALLDRQAGGDFTSVAPLRQDLILRQRQLVPFTSLMFEHIIEAIYAR
jgi:hypothetical protein